VTTYWFRAKAGKRTRNLYVYADDVDEAVVMAHDLIAIERAKTNLTGEVWREGEVRLMDARGTIHPFTPRPQLRVV
jgi:hypothetical protein